MSLYLEAQRSHAVQLTQLPGDPFNLGPANARFMGADREFVLQQSERNLYPTVRGSAQAYFAQNRIGWWGGQRITGHLLSSQVACVNHLFAWRQDSAAALAVLQGLDPDFVEALVVPGDRFEPGYVQFEAVSDHQYLNEGGLTRGSQCTSIDALMFGKLRGGECVMVAIEWKYTEAYGNTNKATEGLNADPENGKGMVRQKRYNSLIDKSTQLQPADWQLCYYEPFYQLMRQTLWCAQRVAKRENEKLQADRFLHVHVVPSANGDLLHKSYPLSGKGMEETWRSVLHDQSLYRIVEPERFVAPALASATYHALREYLKQRYWK